MTTPTPHPFIARLEPLIGRWRIGVPGAGGDVEFAWLGDNAFVVQRWRSDPPEFPDGIAVIGPNEAGDGFVQHYFDTRGVARRYEMTLDDGEWRLWRDDPDFAQRFSAARAGRADDQRRLGDRAGPHHVRARLRPHVHAGRPRSPRARPRRLRRLRPGDRAAFEALPPTTFRFWSPPDAGIDRAGFFERCWPAGSARRSPSCA